MRGARVQIIEAQRPVHIRAAGGESHPAPLRRHHRIKIAVAARAGGDLPALTRGDVHAHQLQIAGGIDDRLAFVAPSNKRIEPFAQRDGARWLDAALVLDFENLLGSIVGDVGQLCAVIGPHTAIIAHIRALRDVANAAFVGGHGENLAARGDRDARARRRQRSARHIARDVLPLRAACGQIRDERNRQTRRRTARHIERVEHTARFINDTPVLGGDVANVPVAHLRDLAHRARGGVIAEDVRARVPAIREEIELAAHPHRIELGRAITRNGFLRARFEIKQLQRRRQTPAITAPTVHAAGENRVA